MDKKLYRLKEDRKISGVCSGIALYLNVDATIIRLLWVLVTFFPTGLGILMYVACVFIIPEEPNYYDAEYREK